MDDSPRNDLLIQGREGSRPYKQIVGAGQCGAIASHSLAMFARSWPPVPRASCKRRALTGGAATGPLPSEGAAGGVLRPWNTPSESVPRNTSGPAGERWARLLVAAQVGRRIAVRAGSGAP